LQGRSVPAPTPRLGALVRIAARADADPGHPDDRSAPHPRAAGGGNRSGPAGQQSWPGRTSANLQRIQRAPGLRSRDAARNPGAWRGTRRGTPRDNDATPGQDAGPRCRFCSGAPGLLGAGRGGRSPCPERPRRAVPAPRAPRARGASGAEEARARGRFQPAVVSGFGV